MTLRRELRKVFKAILDESFGSYFTEDVTNEVANRLADTTITELDRANKRPEPSVERIQEAVVEANKSVDTYLALSLEGAKTYWKGRDIFADNHLPYADWYHNKTNQVCNKRQQRSWMKAFSEWQDAQLSIEDLEEAYNIDILWRRVFTDPNELTAKAIAVKALREVKPTEERHDDNDFPFDKEIYI
jgi:hypothetical protein